MLPKDAVGCHSKVVVSIIRMRGDLFSLLVAGYPELVRSSVKVYTCQLLRAAACTGVH
jgi:5,10-methylenetetrahydrofolate reductase